MAYLNITNEKKKNYVITTPGVHIFYFANKSGELTFHVKHPKAKVYVFGIYEGKGDARYAMSTIQKHTVPGAESHVLIKGVFTDQSQCDYSGLINITKNAPHTNATLENRNLIIGDAAHVTTKPALEIMPADVTCTHAATISYVNTEQTAFMRTRGVDKKTAEKLLIDGFLEEVQQKIKVLQCG